MKINQAFEILRRAGGVRAARIITENQKNLTYVGVWRMARGLRRGMPVAKIIHKKWFYGLPFYTNRYTLDPRPDTETVVEAVIADCATPRPRRILDLGTGTGCIIISLVKNIANATGTGVERSFRAACVARRNARTLAPGAIKILRRSFERAKMPGAPYDIIVSNPPYIAAGDNRVDAGAHYDPACALYAADNGLGAYRTIAKNARAWIKDSGRIYLEIGDGQSAAVLDIFTHAGWTFVRSVPDLAGITRVLVFSK